MHRQNDEHLIPQTNSVSFVKQQLKVLTKKLIYETNSTVEFLNIYD